VVDADADPGAVVRDVVDAVGVRAAERGNHEVVDADVLGLALRAPFLAAVLEVADDLLLFRIDRDGGVVRGRAPPSHAC
jgi:hypothetical protein